MIWLPSLLTGLNLFFGFWAIVQAIEGHFLTACWFIVIASICDGLDGKLARLMNKSSEMGVELDSLADTVSFGVAPGVLLYLTSFHKLAFMGIFLASLPLLFGVIRLARFNLSATIGEKKAFYVGLPIPIQANAIATFIIFNYAFWGDLQLEPLLIPLTIALAILMVSHIPYEGMPRFSIKETLKSPLRVIFILLAISLIALKPPLAFFPLISLYILRGLVLAIFGVTPAEEELDSELEIK